MGIQRVLGSVAKVDRERDAILDRNLLESCDNLAPTAQKVALLVQS